MTVMRALESCLAHAHVRTDIFGVPPAGDGTSRTSEFLAREIFLYSPPLDGESRHLGRFVSPTILRLGPYRFFFYSNDALEPLHVHVERDCQTATFWLQPIRLAASSGFSARELRSIESIVKRYEANFREAWDEHFTE